ESGTVLDVFGDINLIGTGQPWEYTDGFAYRNNNTGPDGSTFVLSNWTVSGINDLDRALTNGTAPVAIPIGTYTRYAMIHGTLTLSDAFSNMSACDAFVIVFDTLSPNIHCIPPATCDLDLNGNLTLSPVDIDNLTTDACDIQTMTLSQSNFDCSD